MTKYACIIADPPWAFGDGLVSMKKPIKRSARSQYKTLSASEVSALNVSSLADPDGCVLALWVPSSLIPDGLQVMSDWGFKFKTTYVWVKLKKGHAVESDPNKKTRVGMGHLFRASHELALIGTSGKSVYKNLEDHSQRSVGFELNIKHSQKPECLQDSLDLMFPNADKLEIFARRQRKGWICLGDAIDGNDINVSIQTLISV